MANLTRKPIVANHFYPGSAKEITNLLNTLSKTNPNNFTSTKNSILGGIVPHAGYIYSGIHAAKFFQHIAEEPFDTAIIISPGHTGEGLPLSIDPHSFWETPLGTIACDIELIDSTLFIPNKEAQQNEHAAEVMIPMIQHLCPLIKSIAVITMRNQNFSTAQEVAQKLSQYKDQNNKTLLVIASCDFSHFVSPETGFNNDNIVLNKIFSNNRKGIEDSIKKHNISICGYGPIMALMIYLNNQHKLVNYEIISRGNSGEVIKSNSVVDYITITASISNQ